MNKFPALKAAYRYCQACGIQIPQDMIDGLESIGLPIKAMQEYSNALMRIVSIYLNDLRTHPGLTGANFGVDYANAIETNLTDAFRAGLRQNDVTEITEEWQAILDEIIASERSHIPDLAEWLTIVEGNSESIGDAMRQASARVTLWAERWNDVYNRAVLLSSEEKTKLIWVFGQTEQHCSTCAQLNGIVAYAREWEESGLHPQSPPNAALECGGWKCDCSLQPTDKRRSRNALARLLDIAAATNL